MDKYQLRSNDQIKQGSKILMCFGQVKCTESPKKKREIICGTALPSLKL